MMMMMAMLRRRRRCSLAFEVFVDERACSLLLIINGRVARGCHTPCIVPGFTGGDEEEDVRYGYGVFSTEKVDRRI